jgi:hypothetical protein
VNIMNTGTSTTGFVENVLQQRQRVNRQHHQGEETDKEDVPYKLLCARSKGSFTGGEEA